MSRLKKKAFSIILGSMLCIMSCFPVFAAEPGISPHVEAGECPQCGGRSLYTHKTEEDQHHDELIDGVYYHVYKITWTDHCDNCGYTNTDVLIVHRRS